MHLATNFGSNDGMHICKLKEHNFYMQTSSINIFRGKSCNFCVTKSTWTTQRNLNFKFINFYEISVIPSQLTPLEMCNYNFAYLASAVEVRPSNGPTRIAAIGGGLVVPGLE
uniref:Uncharacterized protein n=1 Tax=Oryza brachyantha TaxID=4533 RepID=J3M8I6_ORYBR